MGRPAQADTETTHLNSRNQILLRASLRRRPTSASRNFRRGRSRPQSSFSDRARRRQSNLTTGVVNLCREWWPACCPWGRCRCRHRYLPVRRPALSRSPARRCRSGTPRCSSQCHCRTGHSPFCRYSSRRSPPPAPARISASVAAGMWQLAGLMIVVYRKTERGEQAGIARRPARSRIGGRPFPAGDGGPAGFTCGLGQDRRRCGGGSTAPQASRRDELGIAAVRPAGYGLQRQGRCYRPRPKYQRGVPSASRNRNVFPAMVISNTTNSPES